MNTEKLSEAITLIDDDLIDEAGTYAPKKEKVIHWKRWTALAACLVLAVGMGGAFLSLFGGRSGSAGNTAGAGGSGADGASTFMSYAGPVFPLTTVDDAEGITAQRDITLDFAPWSSAQYSTDILVTDSYTLTNSTDADQTLSVLYPFNSDLWALDERQPVLTADGTELETDLLIGPYSGGFQGTSETSEELYNLDQINSWEEYQVLLEDGSYLKKTLSDFQDLSGTDVIVYKFTDPRGPEKSANLPNPSFRVMFSLNYDKTTVLSYNFNAGYYDRENGTMGRGSTIPQAWQPGYGEPCYLILLGDDVENMEIDGYATGGWDTTAKLEEFSVDVERYETDFGAILREVAGCLYRSLSSQTGGSVSVDFETYFGLFCDYLLAYGDSVDRYSEGMLEDYWDVYVVERVCYLQAEITIPAGENVTLSAQMAKPASFDYYCTHTENQGVNGYDMVTRLGSTLSFTGQTATLLDRGQIEIVRQNFGFDLENSITTVGLSMDTEHYYLEVKRSQALEDE